MSKGLGWAIKLISWFAIYFIFSMSFGGDMPFWAYIVVVFLCIVVQGIVENLVKKEQNEKSGTTAENKPEEKKEDE